MFGNFDYKKGFFLRFFNELINVDNIDNKFFFQFFFFKTYGVRLQFFFGFVRNWLKLSYKLYYNYIRLRDIACFREVAFKKLYLDFVVIRKLHFDQKVSFHPNNNQKYIRSNVWNNAFTLSKRKCVVSGGKGRNFYLGPRNLSGKYKVFTKRLSKRFKSLSYGFSGNFDFSKYKFFDNHFLFLRKSSYFFKLDRSLNRLRKSFIKSLHNVVKRPIIKKFFYNRRLFLLREKLMKDFRNLFNDRFFLKKLQNLFIRFDVIDFYNLCLRGVKLYLQFRLRYFLIWISLFLSRPLVSTYNLFSVTKSGFKITNCDLPCIVHKRLPFMKFFSKSFKRRKLGPRAFGYKKSFFYFFKDPQKKIKKRFFIRLKKIKKRFFKNNNSGGLPSKEVNESPNNLISGVAKRRNSLLVFSKYFLRKREFFFGLAQDKRKVVSSSFTFFGQRFTGKNSNIRVLVLLRALYRLGVYRSHQILLKFRRNANMRLFNFSAKFRVNLEVFLRTLVINEVFKRAEEDNFNRKLAIRSYHSTRFRLRLPIRGQRTHSNAGTPKRLRNRN